MNKYRDVRYIFHISICLCFVLFLNLVSINGDEVNGTSSRENPSTSTPAVRQPDGTSRVGPEQQTPQRVQPEEEEEKDFSPILEREPPGAAESDEQTSQDDVVGEAAEDLTDNGDENNDENDGVSEGIDAPVAIYGNNIYVTWWTNETGNDEVMFRASTDSG